MFKNRNVSEYVSVSLQADAFQIHYARAVRFRFSARIWYV